MATRVEDSHPHLEVAHTHRHSLFYRQTIIKRLRSRAVGFNPFRQQDKTRTDVLIVITFLVITLLVVVWAVVGG